MKKKLYLNALILSPVFALFGVIPLLIFEKIYFDDSFKLLCGITFEVAIIWFVNIYFELKYPDQKLFIRFILTYCIGAIIRLSTLFLIPAFKSIVPIKEQKYIAFPIISSFLLNIIIMIIIKSIVKGNNEVRKEKLIQELKWQNTEAQKQVLIQQLQPHFLFNALSTLKSLIKENPDEAEKYTLHLADFLRYSLQSNNFDLVTLEKELSFVIGYINLQKIRFGKTFLDHFNISDVNLKMKLPVLALQLLVENIFKHNYLSEKNPLKFSIVTYENSLIVYNEKKSVKLTEKNNTGLKNLNTRYQLICNKNIQIIDTHDQFKVIIPLLNS